MAKYFVLDANAIARLYYRDIGFKNLQYIYNRPDTIILTISIAIVEVVSALHKAINDSNPTLKKELIPGILAGLYLDIEKGKIKVLPTEQFIENKKARDLIQEHTLKPGMGFGSSDSLYFCACVMLSKKVKNASDLIFVTADLSLYNATSSKSEFTSFHFWTCNIGNSFVPSFIPHKGKNETKAEYSKCKKCGNQLIVRNARATPNQDASTGSKCEVCHISVCPSTYSAAF